jgi:hypothetical protein
MRRDWMITLDERVELHLPKLKERFYIWIRGSYPYLWMYHKDLFQDAIVRVLVSRPKLKKVMGEKKDEAERNRVFPAYIQKTMERKTRDCKVFYLNMYSIPAHHKYKKTTPAFVPGDARAVSVELDDTRVILKDCSPTEDDLPFRVELSRAAERLSEDARILLALLRNNYQRHEVIEIMEITLWHYRSLIDELRRELAYIRN